MEDQRASLNRQQIDSFRTAESHRFDWMLPVTHRLGIIVGVVRRYVDNHRLIHLPTSATVPTGLIHRSAHGFIHGSVKTGYPPFSIGRTGWTAWAPNAQLTISTRSALANLPGAVFNDIAAYSCGKGPELSASASF